MKPQWYTHNPYIPLPGVLLRSISAPLPEIAMISTEVDVSNHSIYSSTILTTPTRNTSLPPLLTRGESLPFEFNKLNLNTPSTTASSPSSPTYSKIYNSPSPIHSRNQNQDHTGFYQNAFRSRLADPHIGDKVEVAWRGKFRLEATEVYQGLAWWVAEVVDKHTAQGKYKIRYPGWESRWDEWVPRSRLRWAVDRNIINQIKVDDTVELWCCGANVPGAWLEARIKRTRDGKYCVGRVLSTGSLWVERDRLRLVRQSTSTESSLILLGKYFYFI